MSGAVFPLIVYHDHCTDGWCAAWLLSRRFSGAELLAASYGDPPPEDDRIRGRVVYVVDFSYDRETLVRWHSIASSLVVLDHHESAEKSLAGLPFAEFSDVRSGCGLVAKYIDDSTGWLTPMAKGEALLASYAEDRDLWRFQMPGSRAVNAYIDSFPRTDEDWWKLMGQFERQPWAYFAALGENIIRNNGSVIRSHMHRQRHVMLPTDDDSVIECKVVNATTLHSEIGGELAKSSPSGVGIVWRETDDGSANKYSLRSTKCGQNVAKIAECYGGGGHAHAASFTHQFHPWMELIADE